MTLLFYFFFLLQLENLFKCQMLNYTGCPKKSGALGFKLIMTSRGVFWMWMGFYYSGHLLLHSWAACECSPPDLILFWTLQYSIETRIIRLVTNPKAPLFLGHPVVFRNGLLQRGWVAKNCLVPESNPKICLYGATMVPIDQLGA